MNVLNSAVNANSLKVINIKFKGPANATNYQISSVILTDSQHQFNSIYVSKCQGLYYLYRPFIQNDINRKFYENITDYGSIERTFLHKWTLLNNDHFYYLRRRRIFGTPSFYTRVERKNMVEKYVISYIWRGQYFAPCGVRGVSFLLSNSREENISGLAKLSARARRHPFALRSRRKD